MEAQMPTRARSRFLRTTLAAAALLLLAAPGGARAGGRPDLDLASLAAPAQPAMCPAQRAREAESQLFTVREQLAQQLPQQPADPSFKVLNTRGANYASGQRIGDPALFHFERLSVH
jgi:hypothetical protein